MREISMIKFSIFTIAWGLLQLAAAQVPHAAPPNEATPIPSPGEQPASDSQVSQTSVAGKGASSTWPSYQPAEKLITGDFHLAFETETERLAESLRDEFREYYPQLDDRAYNVQLDASQVWWEVPEVVGLLRLQMTASERAAFERRHGHSPTPLPVAMSGVAIVVHPDNPIVERGLSLAELDAIFSEARDRGHPEVSLWGDLGLSGEWELRPIYAYRVTETNSLSDFFQQHVLEGGQFKTIVTRESTSDDVIKRIGGYEAGAAASEGNTDAIGFAYLEELTDTVEEVPISVDDEPGVFPTAENLQKARYPLRQYTYLYLIQSPDQMKRRAQLEFVHFVFSQQGQQILQDLNYTPVPKVAVLDELEKLRATGKQRQ